MTALICPRCWTVAIIDAPQIGAPCICPCLERPPITRGVAMVRLRLPEGYELARISPAQTEGGAA